MNDWDKHVLVVDDDEAIRTMVERVLRRERFRVDSARDGFEAIQKLSQNDYGAIVLDLMMPRVDGLGVLRYIERERPEVGKVIVMTANVSVAAEAAKASPVSVVLPKPFDIRELIDQLRDQSAA